MRKCQFCTDCEGPVSKNDNAFELSELFIPSGDAFFNLLSKYDDFLADIARKPGYKPGDTLRLIPPFLKAYGATNQKITRYSAENILLVPGAKETLQYVNQKMPSFLISTSYEPYILALCIYLEFPKDNAYYTKLDLDRYNLNEKEIARLKEIREEIAAMPMLEWDSSALSLDDLATESKEIIRKLDLIFWEEISGMRAGEMLREVNPIGGVEKANAIVDSLKRTGREIGDVLYVGDSITDVQALTMVKENKGVAVSFNGNSYAIRSADIACMSANTAVISILADAFLKGGREEVFQLVDDWSYSYIKDSALDKTVVDKFLEIFGDKLPVVKLVADSNQKELIKESEAFRKTVRGEAIGKLG
jgi:energy-converting hydrogenase A subunit R